MSISGELGWPGTASHTEVFWAVHRHALSCLRAGELLTSPMPNGVAAVAMWRDGPLGAVLFHAPAGAALAAFDIPQLHVEMGTLRPLLRRWKWSGACGFGVHGNRTIPADGLRVVGRTGGDGMTLRCGQAGADVAALRVTGRTATAVVPVGRGGFFLIGRPTRDAGRFAVALDRDGDELPGATLRF